MSENRKPAVRLIRPIERFLKDMSEKIGMPDECINCGKVHEPGECEDGIDNPSSIAVRLIRPVKCHFCGGQMFYADDERFESEIRVTVDGVDITEIFYAHVRCWNERMERK